jgi:hypothetical protein
VLEVAAFLLALAGYVYLVGWLTNWARFAAARLPIDVVATLPPGRVFGDGLRSTVLSGALLAGLAIVAYALYARRWEENREQWHDIVRKRGVGRARVALRQDPGFSPPEGQSTTPVAEPIRLPPGGSTAREPDEAQTDIGETGVRILAGFNVLLLSAVFASAATVLVDEFATHAWWGTVPTWLGVFAGARWLLTRRDPLKWNPLLQGALWFVIAAVALFASAPLAVLVLTGVAISTFGRRVARLEAPQSRRDWLRSPIPWILLAIVALMGLAFQATPPVSFPGVLVTATTGPSTSGGYVTHADGGIYVATCTAHFNGTSTNEHVTFLAARDVKTVILGGRAQTFDSGQRPSLATLALKALGLKDGAPTLIKTDLRPRRAPCLGGAPPSAPAKEQPSLGPDVIGPAAPVNQAHDGEPPIEQTSTALIAARAREFQPTLEVSVADRFWPVSLGAVIAERGAAGEPTCLVQSRKPHRLCEPSPSKLEPTGSVAGDYLQLPVHLLRETSPERQFEAFERGQQIQPGTVDSWLANPTLLNPWHTAQVYFYYAGVIDRSRWPASTQPSVLPTKVETLEYWFYYPYNYYPLKPRSNLMEDAPLAAMGRSVDYHQGDWEHMDVLLDPENHKPLWLYVARHDGEGQFIPWASAPLLLDHSHPVVQAAFGGHPTYAAACGEQRRAKTRNFLSDWLVCGSPRFVFPAQDTPLVDLAATPWGCWQGHFGEAIPGREVPENVFDELLHVVWVAGPSSPLQQAENHGVCARDPRQPELKAR